MNGIIVGSDHKQEGFLSWWWSHYSKHNSYPVVFFDFGMTAPALNWCRERGTVIAVQDVELKELSLERKEKWEKRWGEGVWISRSAWFKKAEAMLRAPFDLNCWLDLDCQVMGNLKPLFDSLKGDIALLRESEASQKKDQAQYYALPGEITYNSGVMVVRKNAPFLTHWAAVSKEENDRFLGDQNALSRVLYLHETPVTEWPPHFHWFRQYGPNPEALIIHYVQSAKLELIEEIRSQWQHG